MIENPKIIYVMGIQGDWHEYWNRERVNEDDVEYILKSEYYKLQKEVVTLRLYATKYKPPIGEAFRG